MAIKSSTLDNGVGLIEARGSLTGGDETVELRQAVAGFVERNYAKLLIDMSGVTYVNSTAIGVLVAAPEEERLHPRTGQRELQLVRAVGGVHVNQHDAGTRGGAHDLLAQGMEDQALRDQQKHQQRVRHYQALAGVRCS